MEIPYAVSFQNTTISNIPESNKEELNNHNHEEADTLMILHAIDVASCNPFRKVIVCSLDTDVFLLLIHHYESLSAETHFLTGFGDRKRIISVGDAFNSLPKHRQSLLGFHAFTSCDTTSKFAGKTKLTCWRTLMKADQSVIRAFEKLGDEEIMWEEVSTGLEWFVCSLFSNSKVPAGQQELAKVRWRIFSTTQNADKLPPTCGALKYKILRSHLATSIWKDAYKAKTRELDPVDYGWYSNDDGKMMPKTTDESPAPESVIELCVCSCTSGCNTNLCTCRRNRMWCTDMCQCIECGNDDGNDAKPVWEEDEESTD